MVPSLPLLSCASSVSVKENPDRKKKREGGPWQEKAGEKIEGDYDSQTKYDCIRWNIST